LIPDLPGATYPGTIVLVASPSGVAQAVKTLLNFKPLEYYDTSDQPLYLGVFPLLL